MIEEWLIFLNQPLVLWTLLAGGIGLVVIDLFSQSDWPAYIGFGLFGIFVGASGPITLAYCCLAIAVVFGLILLLQKAMHSRYLTDRSKYGPARSQRKVAANRKRNRIDEAIFSQLPADPETANYIIRARL